MGVLAVGLTVLGLVAGTLAFGRPRRLPPTGDDHLADVNVIVPARNEAQSLPHLLHSLRPVATGLDTLTVIDDGSTDATGDIARSFPATTVLTVDEPPNGWIGKSWACASGAAATTGETLVFVDADVTFSPRGLHEVVAAHRASGAVISVQPHHTVQRFIEHASWLPNVVSFMAIGAGSSRPSTLYGPVICCSRAQYEAFGGHAAVRGAIAEDVEIGRRLRDADIPFEVYAGGRSATFRMYPGGARELFEGWTKNLATGSVSVRPLRAAAATLWVYALLQASLLTVSLAAGGHLLGAAALFAAGTASLATTGSALGTFRRRFAPLFPLWALMFTALMASSAYKTLIPGRVRWRGRDVDIPRRGLRGTGVA